MLADLESTNPLVLELDPNHPGINDDEYNQRRAYFFKHSRAERLAGKKASVVDYTEAEQELWRYVSQKLEAEHEKSASELYLRGKKILNITNEHIPQQSEINQLLAKYSDFSILPAEGLLSGPSFFYYLTQRHMPCTQFLRYATHPEYTPEPDMIHDMIGHVPQLIDPDYARITSLIGKGMTHAQTEEEVIMWGRVYWFSIEFSLIEENGILKVFGAGIFSSFGEMQYCMTDAVEKRPYNIDDVIATDYDINRMQDVLFVLPSLAFLESEVRRLLARMEID